MCLQVTVKLSSVDGQTTAAVLKIRLLELRNSRHKCDDGLVAFYLGGVMLKAFGFACMLQVALVGLANAAGPFGTIKVGNWIGGAYSDQTGAF